MQMRYQFDQLKNASNQVLGLRNPQYTLLQLLLQQLMALRFLPLFAAAITVVAAARISVAAFTAAADVELQGVWLVLLLLLLVQLGMRGSKRRSNGLLKP